ncbi:MAG: DsbA family protein, partial [Solirubrobacterales bacterium]|nr:DsbA family protein [Solirubrobacterales bacterium]
PAVPKPAAPKPAAPTPAVPKPAVPKPAVPKPAGPATDPDPQARQIERLVAELGLQPVRWPPKWPPDSTQAMLAATYAKRIGRAVAFSLAAFRQAFAGGRDLGEENTILIAGAACEMHPTALRKGIELASTATALRTATYRAQVAGVTALPAVQVGDRVYAGIEAIREATHALERAGAPQ